MHETAVPWPPEFDQLLRGHLPFLAPDEPLLPDSPLVELGLDSLAMISLLLEIDERFGAVIPDEMLSHELFATPQSLWHTITDLRPTPSPTPSA